MTLALCQDVQAEAFDYPEQFFAPRLWHVRRRHARMPANSQQRPRAARRQGAADHRRRRRALLRGRPMRSLASPRRTAFRLRKPRRARARCRTIIPAISAPSASPARRPRTRRAKAADVILAVGTRLQDFTTGSWTLFRNPARRLIGLNVQPFDATKHHMLPLVADARAGLTALDAALAGHRAPARWLQRLRQRSREWREQRVAVTAPSNAELPSDAQVIGAVQRALAAGRHRGRAPPAACRVSCTSCGRRARSAPITWNMAIPAWATRSPAASA